MIKILYRLDNSSISGLSVFIIQTIGLYALFKLVNLFRYMWDGETFLFTENYTLLVYYGLFNLHTIWLYIAACKKRTGQLIFLSIMQVYPFLSPVAAFAILFLVWESYQYNKEYTGCKS